VKRDGNAHKADLTAYIGASGSGKSTLVKQRLLASKLAPLIWSPKETIDRYAPEFGELVDGEPELLIELAAEGKAVVYRPRRSDEKLFAKQFDVFCRLAFSLGNRAVLVEEMALVATSTSAPASWRTLVTEGRGFGLVLIATTQRPQLCDSSLLDAATEIFCGRLNRGGSKKIMAEVMDVPLDTVRGLKPFQFVRWRVEVDGVELLAVERR
jgi:hypothetical protein